MLSKCVLFVFIFCELNLAPCLTSTNLLFVLLLKACPMDCVRNLVLLSSCKSYWCLIVMAWRIELIANSRGSSAVEIGKYSITLIPSVSFTLTLILSLALDFCLNFWMSFGAMIWFDSWTWNLIEILLYLILWWRLQKCKSPLFDWSWSIKSLYWSIHPIIRERNNGVDYESRYSIVNVIDRNIIRFRIYFPRV